MRALSLALALFAFAVTPGLAQHSALLPHGPRAGEIAQLAWILFAMSALVLLLVVVCTVFAWRGSPRARALLAQPGAVVAGGIVLPVLVLSVLLFYGVWLTRAGSAPAAISDAERIEVTGEQWWWRVTYRPPGRDGIASANEIVIPVGRAVEFVLTSADVIHSFWVPSLGGKMDMFPGRTTRLVLKADQPGIYRGQCAEYCGGPHALMALKVIALGDTDHATRLRREADDAAAPETGETRSGRALFLAAGCGACHAVRGTVASGTLGPDLTHLASRSAIGAEAAPLTRASIARFISDSQHVKPGNLMPPFRIFSETERAALAAWLMSLK